MPKSQSGLIVPNHEAAEQWAIHVYGPVLRRNPDHEDDLVPVWAIHDPRTGYNEFFLVDIVTGVSCDFSARYAPKAPLPAGIGGSVVAAFYLSREFRFTTLDPWNWTDKAPPRILIKEGMSKQELYKEVIRKYSRRRVG